MGEMAMPGEDATMHLRLLKPMVLEAGQHFTIRDHGGTIGTGKVTDIKDNLTDEEKMLMQMNKEKRAKFLAKKAASAATARALPQETRNSKSRCSWGTSYPLQL